jgi:NADH-ubiquinone oxidoreductase chain 2
MLIFYNNDKQPSDMKEKNNSPIQYIIQLKGFYTINPTLSLSLTITLLSFLGVPPLIGFFGKQMVLSAALNNGYIFITLIAILTSVISAVYYLFVIKTIYFEKTYLKNVMQNNNKLFELNKLKLSSNLTSCISIFTLLITVYLFTGKITLD